MGRMAKACSITYKKSSLIKSSYTIKSVHLYNEDIRGVHTKFGPYIFTWMGGKFLPLNKEVMIPELFLK